MLEQIERLSDKEARELHARLSLRLSKQRDYSPNEMAVWDALIAALRLRGFMPLDKFVTQFGVAKFRTACEATHDLITQGSSIVIRAPVRRVLLQTVLECLVEHMQARHIPATPSTILGNISSLPWAVEEAFPGYSNARLLHRLAPLAS